MQFNITTTFHVRHLSFGLGLLSTHAHTHTHRHRNNPIFSSFYRSVFDSQPIEVRCAATAVDSFPRFSHQSPGWRVRRGKASKSFYPCACGTTRAHLAAAICRARKRNGSRRAQVRAEGAVRRREFFFFWWAMVLKGREKKTRGKTRG